MSVASDSRQSEIGPSPLSCAVREPAKETGLLLLPLMLRAKTAVALARSLIVEIDRTAKHDSNLMKA